jgi:Rrf2 family transcriptional regulator, iron-sulfur cluster assembly transcription factor
VSVADIILAVDEPLDATSCGGKEDCHTDGGPCLTHDLWANLNSHIFGFLSNVHLHALVEEARAKNKPASHVPVNLIDNRPRFRRAAVTA